ncbi:hypothetical protein ACSSV8_003619 [Roseovarius sp. MBR-79]
MTVFILSAVPGTGVFGSSPNCPIHRVIQRTTGRGTFVPPHFDPGEASQFDWSEDFAVLGGERTKLQMAHIKLSHSRAFLLRAYPLQTGLRPFRAGLIHWINPVSPSPHEMLFDATGTRSGSLAASLDAVSMTAGIVRH